MVARVEISGGDKLRARLAELSRKLSKGGEVKVGFLADSTYPNGMKTALVAAFNEFGVPSHGQPPRPFFRSMVAEKSPEWPAAIEGLLVANDYDVDKTLAQTGEAIAGQLRQSIVDLTEPPLAPSTVARKGGVTKPLIDTGHLLASVDYEVVDKG